MDLQLSHLGRGSVPPESLSHVHTFKINIPQLWSHPRYFVDPHTLTVQRMNASGMALRDIDVSKRHKDLRYFLKLNNHIIQVIQPETRLSHTPRDNRELEDISDTDVPFYVPIRSISSQYSTPDDPCKSYAHSSRPYVDPHAKWIHIEVFCNI